MTTSPTTILVGVDGSAGSAAAVDWAADEAHWRSVPLVLVHVAPVAWPGIDPQHVVESGQDPLWFLEEAERRAAERWPGLDLRTTTVVDSAAHALVSLSNDAALVVVGAHGRSFVSRLLLGSVSGHVMTHARCPAVVVRSAPLNPSAPVAVGIDDSATARAALETAFEEAWLRGAPLVVVHAWQLPPATGYGVWSVPPDLELEMRQSAERLMSDALVGWAEKFPDVEIHERVVNQHPVEAVLEQTHHAQLLVLGAHGRGAFHGMAMGSVASAAVHEGACPVMVVPPAP